MKTLSAKTKKGIFLCAVILGLVCIGMMLWFCLQPAGESMLMAQDANGEWLEYQRLVGTKNYRWLIPYAAGLAVSVLAGILAFPGRGVQK